MAAFPHPVLPLLVAMLLSLLTSCADSHTAAADSPAFYWNAARTTYVAGDYLRTVDNLERVIEDRNEFSGRALPWSLMLTSGVAAAYIELADAYQAGARVNPNQAVAFRRLASEYRRLANPLVLRFAGNLDKLSQLPPGSITLAFPPPKGSPAMPPALAKVAAGIPIPPAEAEALVPLVVDRNVLQSTCLATGSWDDVAKARETLGHASTITPRSAFLNGLAQMADLNAALYDRDKLDNPETLAMLKQRAADLREDAVRAAGAMVVTVREKAQ